MAAADQFLSERIQNMSESATLAMAGRARELQAKGIEVIKLNLGEPDFPTPKHVQEAAKQAVDDGYFFYPPVPGYPSLRQGIADKLKRDNKVDYTPEQIVVSTGAKQSIANVMLSLLNPGDEVIVFAPYWVSYYDQIKLAEGEPVILSGSLENDFKVTAEQLKAAITPKTKAIIYSSPCNPTGSIYTEKELEQLAEVLKENEHVFIISDEIYEYITFGEKHVSIATFNEVKERVVIINGVSKGYSMTGWRIGYMAGPQWLAKACQKIQGQFTSGASTISQKAAEAAITGPQEATQQMRDAYLRRRDLVKGLLDDIPGFKTNLPQGAFYIFPDVSHYFGKSYTADGQQHTIGNSSDLAMYLLTEVHVAVVEGGAFGAPNCIRISYAASDEQLTKACKLIKEAMAKLA
jgi:aspartate aminotransferase